MFCSNCGVNIDEDARFCPSCGSAVSQTKEQAIRSETVIDKNVHVSQDYPAPQGEAILQSEAFVQPTDVPQAEPVSQYEQVSQNEKVAQIVSALQNKSTSTVLSGSQGYPTGGYNAPNIQGSPTGAGYNAPSTSSVQGYPTGYNIPGAPGAQVYPTGYNLPVTPQQADAKQSKNSKKQTTIIAVVAAVVVFIAIVIFALNPFSASSSNSVPLGSSSGITTSRLPLDKASVPELKLPSKSVDLLNRVNDLNVLGINKQQKVDGATALVLKHGEAAVITGWAVDGLAKTSAGNVFLISGDKAMSCYWERLDRSDIVDYYKTKNVSDCGFSFTLPEEMFSNNNKIEFVIISADGKYRYDSIEYNITWEK
jgi:hypothetical protein